MYFEQQSLLLLNNLKFWNTTIIIIPDKDRLLTDLTAQQKGTTTWWYSNKTSLCKTLPHRRLDPSPWMKYCEFLSCCGHLFVVTRQCLDCVVLQCCSKCLQIAAPTHCRSVSRHYLLGRHSIGPTGCDRDYCRRRHTLQCDSHTPDSAGCLANIFI